LLVGRLKVLLLVWTSQIQNIVVLFIIEDEYVAIIKVNKEFILQNLLTKLKFIDNSVLHSDN